MTVLVGIRFKGGLVIASESQESDGYMKRLDVKKVYGNADTFGFTDAKAIVAGTGDSAHIQRLVELIHENGWTPVFTKPRDVADVAEKSMRQMAEQYGETLQVSIMLGAWCKNTPEDDELLKPLALYSVHPPGVAGAIDDYAALGSGGPFASYLLHRFHDEQHPTQRLSVDAATREAVYVVEEAKKVQLHCGGETQVMRLYLDGTEERLLPVDVQRIVSDMKKRDELIKNTQRRMLRR